MISCRTLGPIQVQVDGATGPPRLRWRKNLALLLYLSRSPRGTRSRQHLIALLWADKPEAAARHSLNEAIRILRAVLGDQLSTSSDQVRLQAGAVELDVDELERLATAGDWAGASALVGGLFCEGLGIPDASGFEDWLVAERAGWTRRQVEVLLCHADDLGRRGFAADAAQAAERALELEPTSEPAIRMVMRNLALLGDRAAAFARFRRFRAELMGLLGMVPDAETVALAERLQRGTRLWRRMPASPAPKASTRRLPLVGRARELERMVGGVVASRLAPRAMVVVVEAYSGLGRSRLLEEITESAELGGVSVVAARAVPADRGDAASGIVALACGGLLDAPGIAAAPGSALATLGARITEWGERFPAAAGAGTLSPGRAFTEVVRAAVAERPVLIAVDDAHWLDPESYGMLEGLLRDLARAPLALMLSVMADNSPVELDALRARFGRDVAGEALILDPLTLTDIRQLAAHVLPAVTGEQQDRLARRVLADSAGIPLLVVELLNALASGLSLEVLKRGWPTRFHTLEQTRPGDLPDSIVAAIRVGFRRLSLQAQRTLSTAAVLDEHATLRMLSGITGLTVDVTAAALDELEWNRWLMADARGYAFVAGIVRDVIARDMLKEGQRRRIKEHRDRLDPGP